MIKAYKEFWTRYIDFGGTTSVGGFWWAMLANIIVGAIVGAVAGILNLGIITSIWGLVIMIPELAITIRRLRDGGNHWANIFWSLLPIIGWIILIIKLCK